MTSGKNRIYDAIYAGVESRKTFAKRFPAAKVEGASDDIHTERFTIEDDNLGWQEYLKFVISEGYGEVSLHVQMAMKMPGRSRDRLVKILDELETEKANVRTT